MNLGAGFDTRAYRLPALSDLPVWEVDQRANMDAKRQRLLAALPTIPANVKLVPLDFDREDLGTALAREGYFPEHRTFFICEAVTQYLTGQGVQAIFEFLRSAARGSRLAFTYIRADFLDGTALYAWPGGYRQFVATKLWKFGMTPETCPRFLAQYDWRLIEDVGYHELATKYLQPIGRQLAATAVERIVYAEKF